MIDIRYITQELEDRLNASGEVYCIDLGALGNEENVKVRLGMEDRILVNGVLSAMPIEVSPIANLNSYNCSYIMRFFVKEEYIRGDNNFFDMLVNFVQENNGKKISFVDDDNKTFNGNLALSLPSAGTRENRPGYGDSYSFSITGSYFICENAVMNNDITIQIDSYTAFTPLNYNLGMVRSLTPSKVTTVGVTKNNPSQLARSFTFGLIYKNDNLCKMLINEAYGTTLDSTHTLTYSDGVVADKTFNIIFQNISEAGEAGKITSISLTAVERS